MRNNVDLPPVPPRPASLSKIRRNACTGRWRTLDSGIVTCLRFRRTFRPGAREESMGVLGVVERTTHSYPAVLPFLIIGLLASSLWAYRRRRYWLMGAIAILTVGATLIYTSEFSAEASARLLPAGGSALLATPAGGGGPPRDGPPQFANFSSTMRLHPRFPADFPLPSSFIHEHSSGGLRQGSVTVR